MIATVTPKSVRLLPGEMVNVVHTPQLAEKRFSQPAAAVARKRPGFLTALLRALAMAAG
jgi:hypothetical protein